MHPSEGKPCALSGTLNRLRKASLDPLLPRSLAPQPLETLMQQELDELSGTGASSLEPSSLCVQWGWYQFTQ